MACATALTQYWRHHDLHEVASGVRQAAGLDGIVLPYTRIDGRPAFPVARVEMEAVRTRLDRNLGPILDRAQLRDFSADGFADAPPRAVVLAGYVMVEPFTVARAHLAALRTWAPTLLAVPTWSGLDVLDAAECDYFGHQVWISDGHRASYLKLSSGRQPARLEEVDAWQRLRDEQMFDLALATGAIGHVGAARGSISS